MGVGGQFVHISEQERFGSAFFTGAGTVQLRYLAGANGSISGPATQTIPFGGNGAAVTAAPASGYQFDDWSDGRSDNPRTDTSVMADITVTATFVPVPVTTVQLTYQAGPNGSLSGATNQTIPMGGSGSAVTAVPATGYRFDDWSDGRSDNPRSDTNVMANLSVTARFAANSYTLGGTVSGVQGSGLVLSSNGQTRAIAGNGPFQFAAPLPTATAYAVTVSASPSAPAQTCTVTHGSGTVAGADIDTVQVTCVTQTHPVTLSAGSNGTLALAGGQGFPLHAVPDGQPVRIDVQPATGYAIEQIQGCGGQLDGFVFTTAAITAPCTVTASFKLAIRHVDVSVLLTADRSAGDVDDEVTFALVVANVGPADSQSTAISAAPVVHLRDMVWQCDANASSAACPAPDQGMGALAVALGLPAGAQVTFVLTATLEGQGGEEASLAAGATPSSQESDGHPENNHATAQVGIRGALLSDGFESR